MVWELAIIGGLYDGRTLVKMSAPFGKPTDDPEWRAKQAGWAKTDLYKVLGRIPEKAELLNPAAEMTDSAASQTGPVVSEIMGAVVEAGLDWKVGKDGQRYANVKLWKLITKNAAAPIPEAEPEAMPELPPLPEAPSRGAGMPDPEADMLDDIPF